MKKILVIYEMNIYVPRSLIRICYWPCDIINTFNFVCPPNLFVVLLSENCHSHIS